MVSICSVAPLSQMREWYTGLTSLMFSLTCTASVDSSAAMLLDSPTTASAEYKAASLVDDELLLSSLLRWKMKLRSAKIKSSPLKLIDALDSTRWCSGCLRAPSPEHTSSWLETVRAAANRE